MAAAGKTVKALESRPELLQIDDFYMSMYGQCGVDVSNITSYCRLYGMSNMEILEAIQISTNIHSRCENASS